MKTFAFSIIFFVFSFWSHQIIAQSSNDQTVQTVVPQQGNFIDTNKDGVCDNFQNRPANGRGRNFVDDNKDGVCDQIGNRNGRGRGWRNGGKGRGQACVPRCLMINDPSNSNQRQPIK